MLADVSNILLSTNVERKGMDGSLMARPCHFHRQLRVRR